MPSRVFVSFDYDHDVTLKEFLIGQSKLPASPFAISDVSIKTSSPGWRREAERRIASSGVVAVICGRHTATAVGVGVEIQIAQALGKPYFLLQGYSNGVMQRPPSARSSDRMYKWTWNNLVALIGGSR